MQTLGYDPYEQEQRRQAQMAEEAEQTRLEAIEIRVQADQVQRYVDAIAPHLEPCHAAPTRENRQIIEAYMREQGVPEPIWVQVREGVRNLCRRPKGERGR
ncbi:unnamed protein product [marine sediment metagenome]|uniref:Uncharacterized protein n=1 Tax=marine sediment metagenome TaxID=412755 RepID=X1B116_9ZZZZ